MRNRVPFLILVVLFTLFGGGKGSHWRVVTHDRSGWRYEVDQHSIRNLQPTVVQCSVRVSRDGTTLSDNWVLDFEQQTLTLESNGTPDAIMPGSVAADFVRFFKTEGWLPVAGLPAPKSQVLK